MKKILLTIFLASVLVFTLNAKDYVSPEDLLRLEMQQAATAGVKHPNGMLEIPPLAADRNVTRADYPVPYTQNFDASTSMPPNWTTEEWNASYSNIQAGQGVNSSNAMMMNYYYDGSNGQALISPSLGPIPNNTHQISFEYRYRTYSGNNPYTLVSGNSMAIQVSTTGTSGPWTTLYTIDHTNHTSSSNFTSISLPLTGYNGQEICVRFYGWWGAGDDHYFVLDDFKVFEPVDYDLAAISITGPANLAQNTQASFVVTYQNVGALSASGYNIRLRQVGNNTPLATVAGATLAAGATSSSTLNWTPLAAGNSQLYGEIDWTQDQAPGNNQTSYLDVSVSPPGIMNVYIGNQNSTTFTNTHPVNLYYQSSMTQTIYDENQIGVGGVITSIMYRFTRDTSGPAVSDVQIYFGTTTQSTFTGTTAAAWVPWTAFEPTPVYDGQLPIYNQTGTFDVFIPLTNPYAYSGGNLVIMMVKNNTTYTGMNHNWQNTTTTTAKSIHARNDSGTGGYFYPMTGYVAAAGTLNNQPNITLNIITAGLGHITGTVTAGGNPLPDVLLQVTGSNRNAISNANGQYTLGYVPIGAAVVTATKVGYVDYTSGTLTVIEDQTITHNFAMTMNPTVTVTGTVIASDTSVGLAGATVTLGGYAVIPPVTTNASGQFTINNVFSNQTYTLNITSPRYVPYVDNNVPIGGANQNLGNIMINEISFPPRGVVAVDNNSHATITWNAPNIPDPNATIFSHIQSEPYWRMRFGEHGVWYETGHRYTNAHLASAGVLGATLTRIEFMPNGYGTDWRVRAYTGTNGDQPGTRVVDQSVPNVIYDDMNSVLLTNPVTIPMTGDFWISFHSVDSDVGDGSYHFRDSGPAINGFGNLRASGLNPTWGPQSAQDGNWYVQGVVTSAAGDPILISPIVYTIEEQLGIGLTTSHNTQKGVVEHIEIGDSRPLNISFNRNSSRVFENAYNIYRSTEANVTNPNLWTTIATNLTALTYDDNTWPPVEGGIYHYIVRAIYTNNNLSAPAVSNGLMGVGAGQVYIGDPNSTNAVNYIPVNWFYGSSLTQTIYTAEQINMGGLLTHLTYRFQRSPSNPPQAGIPTTIWIGSTDQATISNAYVPFADFNQTPVFSGNIDLSAPGVNNIEIELTNPYAYGGGQNLVIMMVKNNSVYQGSDNLWQNTPSPQRSASSYADGGVQYSPNSYPGITTTGQFQPNITLTFDTAGRGHLTGTVTRAGNPEPGVRVTVDGENQSALTNAAGQYTINYIPQGTISITATKHGFVDYTHSGIDIVEDETTTHNFSMTLLPQVSVTGTLITSDTGAPVVGADIRLTGYENYTGITSNASGVFTIPTVFANHTYELRIIYTGYTPYTAPVVVGGSDVNLGTITIMEIAYPVSGVVAVDNVTNAVISWNEPVAEVTGLDFSFFGPDDEIEEGFYWNSPPQESILAARFTVSRLQQLGIFGAPLGAITFGVPLLDPGFVYTNVKVWVGGTDYYDPGQLVLTQAIDNSEVEVGWNMIQLEDMIDMDQEIRIGYTILQIDAPQSPDIYPIGLSWNQDILVPDESDLHTYQGEWLGFANDYFWPASVPIKGLAVGVTRNIEFSITDARPITPRESVKGFERTFANGTRGPGYSLSNERRQPNTSVNILSNSQDLRTYSRLLLGYNVYRANVNDLNNENAWTAVASNITTLTYTDTTWPTAGIGAYRYGVKAIYSNNNLSAVRFSNIVDIGMSAVVNVTVTDQTNAMITGGTIRMVNHDGDPNHVYNFSSTTNVYTHNAIWLGTYTLTLIHPTAAYTNNNVVISTDPTNLSIVADVVVTIGTGNTNSYEVPINYYYKNSLSQTIYPASEIGITGLISSIEYTFTRSTSSFPPAGQAFIKVYMAEVEQTTLTNWLSPAIFTEVYFGSLAVQDPGTYPVTINFTTPYAYNGGNLAIMVFRPMDPNPWYGSDNTFKITSTPGQNRSIYFRTDSGTEANPDTGAISVTGTLFANYPNIRIPFNVANTGHIAGTVTAAGNPLADVRVGLNGSNRYAMTNAAGVYSLNYVPTGTQGITATKHGYQDYVNNNVVITNTQVTTVNFSMTQNATVTVTGTVIGSDTMTGIAGATVRLEGYENYTGITTNATGQFTIPGVYASRTYTLTINKEGYSRHVDDNVVVGTTNLHIDVTIYEIAYNPRNVVVARVGDTGTVNVVWEEPTPGIDIWFTHNTTDTYINALGVNPDYLPWTYEIMQRFTAAQLTAQGVAGAYLSKISFYPYQSTSQGPTPPNFALKVYTGGTASPWNPGTLVHTQTIPSFTWMNWNEVTLSSEIPIPTNQELWFGLQIEQLSGGHPAFMVNNHTPNFGDVIFWDGQWNTLPGLSSQITPGNWGIKAMASGAQGPAILSHLPNEEDFTTFGGMETESIAALNHGRIIEHNPFAYLTQNIETYRSENSITNDSRVLLGYRIFRCLETTIGNPQNWDLIVSFVPTTFYTHTNAMAGQIGWYQYIVQSVYENENYSTGAMSNRIYVDGVDNKDITELPTVTALKNNYPNPFNPSTLIAFDKATEGNVKIDIYNVKGQKVKSLLNNHYNAGRHVIEWNGVDDDNLQVGSGIYFYRMTTDELTTTRKMIMLK